MPVTVEQAKTELKRRRAQEELDSRRRMTEPGPLGDIAFLPKEPEGVWAYDKQLDDLFSGEVELEDLLPMDVRYDFGKIVGMTSKSDETRAKMTNSLYYSVQLGIPPKMAFSITDQLNEIWFGKKKLPLQPGKLFAQSFIHSLADKPAMMLKGLEVYTPGEGKVDKLLEKSATFLQALKDPKTAEKLQQARAGKLWPIAEHAKWYQIQAKFLPEVINAWATNVGDQIPIMLITYAGRMMGKVAGEPVGAATATAWATATGGLDPTDVATAPLVKTITSKVIEHLGGAAPLVAMETGYFMDEANALKIDKDIAEKYAKIYGPGSGAIEYAQWLWVLGRYKAITKGAQSTIMRQVLTHIGGSAVEGLEEISQEGLQNWLLQKAVAEMKERHPEYTGVAPETWEGWKRSGAIGAGVAMITAMPGTGLTMAQGRIARREIVKPETKMPEIVEVPVAEKPPEAAPEAPTLAPAEEVAPEVAKVLAERVEVAEKPISIDVKSEIINEFEQGRANLIFESTCVDCKGGAEFVDTQMEKSLPLAKNTLPVKQLIKEGYVDKKWLKDWEFHINDQYVIGVHSMIEHFYKMEGEYLPVKAQPPAKPEAKPRAVGLLPDVEQIIKLTPESPELKKLIADISQRIDLAFKEDDLDAMRDIAQLTWELPKTAEADALRRRVQILDGEMLARARKRVAPPPAAPAKAKEAWDFGKSATYQGVKEINIKNAEGFSTGFKLEKAKGEKEWSVVWEGRLTEKGKDYFTPARQVLATGQTLAKAKQDIIKWLNEGGKLRPDQPIINPATGRKLDVDLAQEALKEKPAEPTKPGVSLLGGVPVEPAGLSKAEIEHLGKREQNALRAAQKRGLKVGYKQGAAATLTDARRSLDAFRIKQKISEKMRMDAASIVLTYVPKERQGVYIRRILDAKTQTRIERLTEAIDSYLDKAEKRESIRDFKKFVKDIKGKYRRGEVALGQLPKKTADAIIDILDKFDLAKISEKKAETLESRSKFVNRISGELSKGFEQLTPEMDKDATDLLVMGTRRIEELKRLSQEFIGDLDTDQIKYIQSSLEHLIKINDLKAKSKERRRIENLRTDINTARQEVLPAKAEVKSLTGILGAVRWIAVEGSSTLRTLVGISSGKKNAAMTKLLVEEPDAANHKRKETYKNFIMHFRKIAKQKGIEWSDVSNIKDLTKITIGGKEIEIDYDNLLSLYAHTQAEGNMRRLLKTKGLNITVYSRDKNGILTKKHIYRVGKPTLEELRAIADLVPDVHKKLLDVYFKSNREVQAPAINETSMAYQNFDLARLERYWHVSREFDRVIEGKRADISISINEQGRYLPRTGGNQRINIRPFTVEVMKSMQSDAAYHAMTIPMENARTLIANTKWREAMKRAGQQKALNETTTMLRRTQGLISDQSVIELTASRLLGTIGKSILGLRISGGMVQTASVPAAVEFIKKEHLVQIDIPTPEDIQHLKDISPTLWMRWEAKQFDYALGMVGAENAFESLLFEHRPITEKFLAPYTVGDEIAIAKLFMAAERQIEAETNLKRGTKEFEQASLELLYKAMNTQPQWDMLHRSPVTSDPSAITRSITMFMSARNAQYNVLVRAIDDYRKGRITTGQMSERLAGVGMANLFVSVARHTFKTAVLAGATTFFVALGLRKPPDDEELKEEAVRLAKKIPTETVFNIIGLNAFGSLISSIGYAALRRRKYGWGVGRYGDIRTGSMMADLFLDLMQTGGDFYMFTAQLISGEKYKTGKNRGRYKWEITGMSLIDDISLLIAYSFGLPYEGPKSDIIWPVEKALPKKKKGTKVKIRI